MDPTLPVKCAPIGECRTAGDVKFSVICSPTDGAPLSQTAEGNTRDHRAVLRAPDESARYRKRMDRAANKRMDRAEYVCP
jgi:hypothetical protein